MTDESTAPVGGEHEAAPVIAPANLDSGESFSPEQALEAYQKRTNPTAESADTATADPELAEANADPVTDPSEEPTDAEPEAEEHPPIERPRSWTKDEDAEWQSLPRAMQQKIVAREQERDTGLRRSQNEAAEQRKAIEAERTQAEQARKDYEAKLPAIMQALQDAQAGTFADVKTVDDVQRLANEDPFRYLQWQAHQQKMQAVAFEQDQAGKRHEQERQTKRAAYEAEQNKFLLEFVPEMTDPQKGAALRESAVKMLNDELGLTTAQLQRWMQDDVGHEILANAGIQKLIVDRLKFQAIKAAPAKAIPKPVPAVQKPGVAPAKGAAASENVQALRNKLSGTGSVEDAFALYQAKQNRRA